jgi:hypothetical protein
VKEYSKPLYAYQHKEGLGSLGTNAPPETAFKLYIQEDSAKDVGSVGREAHKPAGKRLHRQVCPMAAARGGFLRAQVHRHGRQADQVVNAKWKRSVLVMRTEATSSKFEPFYVWYYEWNSFVLMGDKLAYLIGDLLECSLLSLIRS